MTIEFVSAIVAASVALLAAVAGYLVTKKSFTVLSSSIEMDLQSGSLASDEALAALREQLTHTDGIQESLEAQQQISEAVADNQTYKVLAKYSAQGLAQSRISFLASIAFASIGFVVLVVGVVAAFVRDETDFVWLPVVAGGIAEAVAALFFSINAQTQKIMVSFFDKLRDDKRIEDAMKIAEGITERELSERLRVLLALKFVDVRDLGQLLDRVTGQMHSPAPIGRTPGDLPK